LSSQDSQKVEQAIFWAAAWRSAVLAAPCVIFLFAYSLSTYSFPDYPMGELFEEVEGY
jgi:hypothetical protein